MDRITHDPAVMGGKPCIRGLRVTVGTILGLLGTGQSRERILEAYPYLEPEDINAALTYAAWRMEERDKLTVAEKLELIDLIWDSLPEQLKPEDVPEWHLPIIAARRAEIEANPGAGQPWREALADIRAGK